MKISTKIIVVTVVVAVVLIAVFVVNSEKVNIDASLLLESTNETYNLSGKILHMEGYIYTFPFSRGIARGTVTLEDKVWKVCRYDCQDSIGTLYLENGSVITMFELVGKTHYFFTHGDESGISRSYTATPMD